MWICGGFLETKQWKRINTRIGYLQAHVESELEISIFYESLLVRVLFYSVSQSSIGGIAIEP